MNQNYVDGEMLMLGYGAHSQVKGGAATICACDDANHWDAATSTSTSAGYTAPTETFGACLSL